jgi:dihydrofolate reductase
MPKLRLHNFSISLDGHGAGPNEDPDNPLGVGGERLHDWATNTRAWRASHGMEGGETSADDRFIVRAEDRIGATIMGRNMFGGPWMGEDWRGWWGDDPPFHHPVFVLTHHPREPLELEGGTTFTFVTEGVETALAKARRAALGKDISLAGGAAAARQYLGAGVVDEMEINLVPVLLGSGERLFQGIDELHGLELVRTVAAPNVTHLKFARQ